jgi:hypothetical protein
MVQCDKPTGKIAAMKFLYPELGNIDAQAAKPERLKQLAALITQKQNGRLARTIVNRLWARFLGRGLVEPVDDMEQPAWHPALLDWLAADLVENGYDLKKTIERILNSEVYQLRTVPASELTAKDYVFRGPLVRRLTAEQFQDAISEVTGVWHSLPASTESDFSAGLKQDALLEVAHPAPARWIWSEAEAAQKAPPGTVYFRRRFELREQPTQASIVLSCDNRFKLYVNGKEVASGSDHKEPKVVDLQPHLRTGENVLGIAATNDSAAPGKENTGQSNPAGLIVYLRLRQEQSVQGMLVTRVLDLGSDASWLCSTNKDEGWEKAHYIASTWKPAALLGEVNREPWKLQKAFGHALSAAALSGHVRAALVAADPLLTALGRPNREQVITSRSSAATTLQALEMTNGKTLAEHLRRGAESVLARAGSGSRELIVDVFERALARPPTLDELALAQELVGTPARREGVEDLPWAVAALPEFQLIY